MVAERLSLEELSFGDLKEYIICAGVEFLNRREVEEDGKVFHMVGNLLSELDGDVDISTYGC